MAPHSMPTAFQHFKATVVSSAVVCAVGIGMPCLGQVEGTAIALSDGSSAARGARIESQGFATAISWIEQSAAPDDTLRFVLLKDGRLAAGQPFPPIRALAAPEGGRFGDADLAIDPVSGRAQFLAVVEQENRSALFAYSGTTPGIPLFESEGLIETPALVFDDAGSSFAAWTELRGGQSFLWTATRRGDEAWTVRHVGAGDRVYDVLPQLLPKSDGSELYWFSLVDSSVYTRSALLSAGAGDAPSIRDLGNASGNRLPIIFQATDSDLLGAWWLEQSEGGERYFVLDPREDTAGAPIELVPTSGRLRFPAISSDSNACFVWLEADAEGEQSLVAENPFGETVRLPVSRTTVDPAISVSTNWVHLVWADEAADAPGSLWYIRAR